MDRDPGHSYRKFAWMFYDGANSIFHLVGITILLPWALTDHWRSILERDSVAAYFASGEQAWGIVVFFAYLLAGPLAWWIGRVADARRLRRASLMIATALTLILLLLITSFFRSRLSFPFLLAPLVLCMTAFTIALSLYDSMLIDAVGGQERSDLSTASARGWAVGYLVSAPVLFVMYWIGMFSSPVDFNGIMKILITVILLFFIMSVVLFRFLPIEIEKTTRPARSRSKSSRAQIALFLTGAFLLIDANLTVALFITILATKLFSLPLSATVEVFLYAHLVAIVTTWPAGAIGQRFAPKSICLALCAAWFTVCAIAYLLLRLDLTTTALVFVIFGVGALIGTTPALIRSLYAELIPPERRGEFFAYTVLTQRSLAFVGPALATAVLTATGNYANFVAVPAALVLLAALVFLLPQTWPRPRRGT